MEQKHLNEIRELSKIDVKVFAFAVKAFTDAAENTSDLDIKAALLYEAHKYERRTNPKVAKDQRYKLWFAGLKRLNARRAAWLHAKRTDLELDALGFKTVEPDDDLGDLDYLTTS